MKETAPPPAKTRAERLAVCARCPIFVNGTCDRKLGGCGCRMSVKAALPGMRCPQGKW